MIVVVIHGGSDPSSDDPGLLNYGQRAIIKRHGRREVSLRAIISIE